MRGIVVGASLLFAASAFGNPEFLPPAMQFGAGDCAFRHATIDGGEGHNERGLWRIAKRERRAEEAVDAAWRAARDTLAVRAPARSAEAVRPGGLPLVALATGGVAEPARSIAFQLP